MIWFAHNESVPIFAIFQLCPQILQKLGYKPLCYFNWNVLNIEWNNLNYENTVWNSELRNEPLLLQASCNKWEGTAFDLRCASNRFIDCTMQSAVIQLWKSTLKKIELRKRSCGLFDFVTAVFILSQCHWFPEDVALYEANLPLRITVYVNRINELLVCDFAESSHPHSKNVLVIFISYTSYPQTMGASLSCE